MKVSSRTEYLQRIDVVVAKLSDSIANERALPSIAELAQAANLSEFHFMRIYRALVAEPLGATIQRLRLARAVHLLAVTDVPVTEVAARVGYETSQAFARAFRQLTGLTPSDVRERPNHHRSTLNDALEPRTAAESMPPVVSVQVIELQPFRVAALRNVGDYVDLDQAYGRLFSWLAEREALEMITALWGVPWHDRRDTPAGESVFDCCLALSADVKSAADITVTELGGGRYITCKHLGSYSQLDAVHDSLLRDVLSRQELCLREAPILHRFVNDPEHTPEALLETVIHIPVAAP